MVNLIIMREQSFWGLGDKMRFFINGKEACMLKDGESFQCEGNWNTIDLRCGIPSYPKSDVFHIQTSGEEYVYVSVKQGIWKPKAIVTKGSEAQKTGIFLPTKTVGSYFGISDLTQQFALVKGFGVSIKNGTVYNYKDLVDFALIEDGASVYKGGLGSAAVGGLLFGGVGAIVGGVTGRKKANPQCTSLMVKITVNNPNSPVEYIKLIESATDKNGFVYKSSFETAQEIVSVLQLIYNQCHEPQATRPMQQEMSAADELRKFKQLLDEGVITQEEFDAKKKQLLEL